jgi:diadenosine tetraphosphatase ApaH/serine/threonine PP2A family protein phosphatase
VVLLGLLSDPHANLPALEAVLDDVRTAVPDALVCLGDFVDYGAQPDEVVAALRDRCSVSLCGNHDLAVLGDLDPRLFNPMAARALMWTAEQIQPETAVFLRSLSPVGTFAGLDLAHASPRDPVEEYVTDELVAQRSFDERRFSVVAVGHTHVPAVFVTDGARVAWIDPEPGEPVPLEGVRAIVNPGAVGQPRDGDPRASWATWDTQRCLFVVRRVDYPIEQSQQAILRAGLPPFLAHRLAYGQ